MYLMVVMWANDGSLLEYIKSEAHVKTFTWYKRLELLEELSDALDIIHSNRMIH